MVGHDLTQRYPERNVEIGEDRGRLTVGHPTQAGVSRDLRGLLQCASWRGRRYSMGAGRTELAMAFWSPFGMCISGKFFKDGKEIRIRNVSTQSRTASLMRD